MGHLKRSRRWAFTVFGIPPREEWLDRLTKTYESSQAIQAIVGQGEICPTTGRKHFQGYMEAKHGITMSTAKKALDMPSAHLSACREGQAANVKYVTKVATRDPEWSEPITIGDLKQQGKRNDWEDIADTLRSDPAAIETLCESHPGHMIRNFAGIARMQLLVQPQRPFEEREVHVLFGPTGTGKTYKAYQADPRLYCWTPALGPWFDGYAGQKTMLMDEFRADVKYAVLLRMLDKYPLTLQVKGTTTQHTADVIYITSPVHPVNWYKNLASQDKIGQLKRRITSVIHCEAQDKHVDVTDSPWEEFLADEFTPTDQFK